MTSSTISPAQYSSSYYDTARSALKGKRKFREKARRLALQLKRKNEKIRQLETELQQAGQKLREFPSHIQMLQDQVTALKEKPLQLSLDLPPANGSYSCKIIALCLNLCKRIGFRPASAALDTVFESLEIDQKVPSYETIRGWACRAGVAQLSIVCDPADDWIWMVDHSNQIGQEKVLEILAIRASDLPPIGETLARNKMKTIAVLPATQWKRDDMRAVYRDLMAKHGAPRFLLTDGAVELHETVDALEKDGKKPVVLRDFKHYAANVFEKLIGKSDEFKSFLSQTAATRSRIQQTELGHFNPQSAKSKARFMNLGPVLRWGRMMLYHYDNPASESRAGIKPERFAEKLGWINEFREHLPIWNRCQKVLQVGLKFVNTHGLYRGCSSLLAAQYEELFQGWDCDCKLSSQLADELVRFILDSESQLREGERAWISTENLESSFGSYKQLEGQQSKGGFTSLVAAMPMLLVDWTSKRVRACFESVSTANVKDWIKKNVGTTLTSKRNLAYKEAADPLG